MRGINVIIKKELADHFSSYRFIIIFALIAMVGFITSYMAGINIRESLEGIAKPKFVFLMLFNTPGALFYPPRMSPRQRWCRATLPPPPLWDHRLSRPRKASRCRQP